MPNNITPPTTCLQQLKNAVEKKAGRRMRTPKDFDVLHQLLFDELHQLVGISTLKRIWGYVKSDSTPRPSSLTPLAQYVGYDSWEAFKQAHSPQPAPESETGKQKRWRYMALTAMGVLLATGAVLTAVHLSRQPKQPRTVALAPSGKRVLHAGKDFFPSTADYLALFGVTATDTDYYQPVPHQHEVYLWGPEYGNTTWHNEGSKDELMPTITEYWTPSTSKLTPEYIRLGNTKLYYERLVRDELRITFMRNINDTLYTFLGIYRIDPEASNTEKTVWRRVTDSIDIGHVAQLEDIRKQHAFAVPQVQTRN